VPHQFVNASVVESNVETPQSSEVVGSVFAGLTPGPVGLKLLGLRDRALRAPAVADGRRA
jgi:hypothetical protein